MKPELHEKIMAYNRQRAEDKTKSDDLMTLLGALPSAQIKQLLKDEACAKILNRYGITGK